MLGVCPNCKIDLKRGPFGKRKTNEMLLVLEYRNLVENDSIPKKMDDLGYCELCEATKEDFEKQKKSEE